MASLGVLASLMQGLTPTMPQYNPLEEAQQQALLQGRRSGNETALLQLAELKREQEAQAQARAYFAANPGAALGQGGGPVLGALQTAPGGPSVGPLLQQQVIPGQPPGAPQVVPGGQDLSRFAGVSPQGGGPLPAGVGMPQVTPPQSTLASLAPPSQANSLEQLMRTNPDAAFQVIAQQQKMFTTQLTMREKTAEAFASKLHGVNSQESYEAAVQDLMQWAPQQAARLPKVWSREAMEPIIASALAAKDKAALDIATMKEATDFRVQRFKEQQAAAGVPKYTEDSTLNVAIDRRMQQAGIPRGTPPPEAILTQAQQDVEAGKVRVSASQGTGQVFDTPEGKMRLRPGTNTVEPLYTPGGQQLQPKPTQAEQETATFANLARQGHTGAVDLEKKGFTPGFWAKSADKLPLHIGNYLTSDEHQKYKDYVMDFAQAWLRRTSKGAITETEWKFVDERYFPQPGNSKSQIEEKTKARENVIKELEAEGKGTGRTGTQAQPPAQGPSGGQGRQSTLKPVGEMSRDELLAERDRLRKGGG